jgi:lipooligosaccharide transport system ATP-binding protein
MTTPALEQTGAERLSDSLAVMKEGRVVATGSSEGVLGDLVGEHVLVLDRQLPETASIETWLHEQGHPPPAHVLNTSHLALDAKGLAAFTMTFSNVRFEVRTPTLDDLFMKLSEDR